MEVGYFLSHYLVLFYFLFSSYLLGIILLKFKFVNKLEEVFISTTLGIGIWSLIIFSLGIMGFLYKPVVLVVNVVILGVVLVNPRKKQRVLQLIRFDQEYLKDLGFVALSVVIILPTFVLFLYPPVAWDSTSFHLATSKIYVAAHKLIYTEFVRFPVFNQLTDMLFTGMLLVSDDASAQAVSWASNFLLIIGIYVMATRFYNRKVGVLSVALWLSAPLILYLTVVAYIDINLTLFAFAAVYCGFIYLFRENETKWLVMTGLFFGFAAGSKYSSLILFCFYLLALNYHLFKTKDIKHILYVNFTLGILVVFVSAPWFIRNYYYSGNPVFPFLTSLFGQSPIWNGADYERLMKDLVGTPGLKKNIVNLFVLPFALSFKGQSFHTEVRFSRWFFIGVVALLLTFKKDKITRTLCLLWIGYYISWFFSAQIPRYLIIVWPLMCITFAWSFTIWIEKLFRDKIILQKVAIALLSSVIIISLSIPYLYKDWYARGSVPVSQEQRDKYLAKNLDTYNAFSFLNTQPSGRLYALGTENMNYFYNGVFIGDWFGPGRYSQVLNNLSSGIKLYQSLHNLKINYFLVRDDVNLPKDSFFGKHFSLIYQDSKTRIYSVNSEKL